MSDPPDDQLLAAAQRDGAAFEAIFDRHFVAIHRYVNHRVGAAAADDLASETFARAFAARHRARTVEGSLRAWLFTIASNLVADEHRTRGRAGQADERMRSAASTAFDAGAEWAADPTNRLQQNPDLIEAVLALRFEEREALLLLAWGELSPAEIGEVTGVAAATVRTRIHRARTALRARLQHPLPRAACAAGTTPVRMTET